MVGVNGVGKTTTIGKLAHKYRTEGKKRTPTATTGVLFIVDD